MTNRAIPDRVSDVREVLTEELEKRILILDGAMGTMLYERGAFLNRAFEELNRSKPDLVFDIYSG